MTRKKGATVKVTMADGAVHRVTTSDRDVAVAHAALVRTGRFHGTLDEFAADAATIEPE